MSLQTQSFDTIVDSMVAAIQANSDTLVDFSVGSILRALVESNAANSMWVQGLVSALLAVTRLATSTGNDVDTFVQDFGYFRVPAVPATGQVTFSRNVTTNQSYIPADGSILVQASSTQTVFFVSLDTTNANYDSATNSYVMNIGISSISVPVQAQVAGTSGNVLAGQIDTILSPLTNVNSVTNSSNFTNGSNAATDDQVRTDFVLYLQGLFKATLQSIESAVANVPGVVRYIVVENQTTGGSQQLGYFYVIVDDGTGSPPSSLISSVQNAVEQVRGLTIQYSVFPPTTLSVTVSVSILIDNQITMTDASNFVKSAIVSYVQSLPIAGLLPYSKVIEVIYDSGASPHILNVKNLLINSATADIQAGSTQVFIISTSSITVNFL